MTRKTRRRGPSLRQALRILGQGATAGPTEPKQDKSHGGYRHGVPGGDASKVRVEARMDPDRKERWEAAAARWCSAATST